MECKKPCGTKICNPKTGRCVKKSGRIGKAITGGDPVNKTRGNVKKIADCDPDKIRNPATGRCVKKSGKIGKSLLSDSIYHPFYKRNIGINSDENCGATRGSIFNYGEKSREVMASICDIIPLSSIREILGPVSYSEYRYGDVTISVFGEFHALREYKKCLKKTTISFGNFIKVLLSSNPSKTYDLYLETDYIHAKAPARNQPSQNNFGLHTTELDFQECLRVNKRLCSFDNLRAHYIDIREHVFSENFTVLVELYHKNPFDFVEKEVCEMVLDEIYDIIKENPLVQKELSKSYLGKDIKKFVLKEFRKRDTDSPKTFAELMRVASLVMDIYTLSRMFRNFADKTMNKNIIIYAGDAHSRFYREFLEKKLGLIPTVSIKGETSCLNLTADDKKRSLLF
jgi:hypothetical protein